MAEKRKPSDKMCEFCHEHPVRAHGLCVACYRRASRNGGDPSIRHRAPKVKKSEATVCRICGRPALNLGLCREHYEADLERRIAAGEIQPKRKLKIEKPERPKIEHPRAPAPKKSSKRKKEAPQWVKELVQDIFRVDIGCTDITEDKVEEALRTLDRPHELALRIKYQGYKYPSITEESKEKLNGIQQEGLGQLRKALKAQGTRE